MSDVFTSSDVKIAFKEQEIFGIAEDDTDEKEGIATEAAGVNSQISFIDYLSSRAQRYSHSNNISVNQKGRVYETDKFKIPAIKNQFDCFLYGIFQNVVEAANGANYQKTFTFPARQPDFTIHQGKYFTTWLQQPVANVSQKINDSIFSEFSLLCNPENDGILWIEGLSFLARSHSDLADPSGTITYQNQDEYFFYDLTKAQIDATDLTLGNNGIKFLIRNNAKRLGIDSGKFKTFILPRYEVEVEIQILYGSLAQNLMAKAKSGTSISFEFEWGTANSDGYLNISGNANISQSVNIEHNQDGNYCTITMLCVGEYGLTEPFQIAMINPTNRYWNYHYMIFKDRTDCIWQDRTDNIFQDRTIYV